MRKCRRKRKQEFGFTTTELLVVIAIFAILASIAIPGYSRWLPSYRLRSAARDLYSNFQLMKMEAVRKCTRCALTFEQPIGGETYSYVLYMDADNDLAYDNDATGDGIDNDGDGVIDEPGETELIIKKVRWADYKSVDYDTAQGGGDGLDFFPVIGGLSSISFRPNGLPTDDLNQPASGTVFLKNTNNRTIRIVLTAGGAVQIN